MFLRTYYVLNSNIEEEEKILDNLQIEIVQIYKEEIMFMDKKSEKSGIECYQTSTTS